MSLPIPECIETRTEGNENTLFRNGNSLISKVLKCQGFCWAQMNKIPPFRVYKTFCQNKTEFGLRGCDDALESKSQFADTTV